MKPSILTILLFFYLLDVSGQNIRNGERYNNNQLRSALSKDIGSTITRDDILTLSVKELELAIPNDSEYLADILIECYGEGETTNPIKKYSYAFNRTEPIPEGGTRLTADYTPIFTNVDISEIHNLTVAVSLTKLENDEVIRLKKVLDKYVNQAFKALQIGDVLTDIIGFDAETKNKRREFKFKASYVIPMNFLEYYIHLEKNIPLLSNKESQIITIQADKPIENNSLTSKVKFFFNVGKKILTGEQYVKEVDFEKIEGYCELLFSKDFNTNIPPYMERALVSLVGSIEEREIEDIKEKISESKDKLEEFINDHPQNQRGHNNVRLLINLARTMESMYEAEIDNNGVRAINKFKAWLRSASTKLATNNFTLIYYKNTYNPGYDSRGRVEKEYDGKIYIPYSLGNKFIEQVITFQQTLHDFTADYFKSNSSEFHRIKYFTKEFPSNSNH